MTTYVEKIIPSIGGGGEVVIFYGMMMIPVGGDAGGYVEPIVPAVTYGECQVPPTVSTECVVQTPPYTEKLI